MKILLQKLKETVASVIPIIFIVLFLVFFVIESPVYLVWQFIIGAILVIFGLTIFLLGIDIAMVPIGEAFGKIVAKSNSVWFILIITFIIGFSVTIAEPDLLILGKQIANATHGVLPQSLTVLSVSVGVGVLISLGSLRLLHGIPLKYFYFFFYSIIFILSIFSEEAAITMGFDASGATTGAFTTPFILALSISLAAQKGGESSKEDAFGLVGAMSIGPILAVMVLILMTSSDIEAADSIYQYSPDIWGPIFSSFWSTFFDSVLALTPILAFFIFFIARKKIRLPLSKIYELAKGVMYTLIGLSLFLLGVHEGFMSMGYYIGQNMAELGTWPLILTGLILGLVVVLAEPAVHILSSQVEEISEGYISSKLLLGSLSIGVGLAVSLSMLRLLLPELNGSYIIFPGFALAILLSFYSSNLFNGIAFDAGGVASGPMTATFILSFSQGAADFLPHTDTLDAFGVIAFVAMTPVVMVEILGSFYRLKSKRNID